jgi:bacteriocin-like protein
LGGGPWGGAFFPENEEPSMTQEIAKKDQDNLVKTSAEGSVELSEKELQQVAGGQKNKADTQQYLKIEMENVLISSYSTTGAG